MDFLGGFFLFFFALDSSQAVSSSHRANAVFAITAATVISQVKKPWWLWVKETNLKCQLLCQSLRGSVYFLFCSYHIY